MAIEKRSLKLSRLDSQISPRRTKSMSSEDEQIIRRRIRDESDNNDVSDDCDSGAGSDDFDLLELGEVGEEFCQVGDQSCSVPFELYDLSDLREILSMDVWNECLTEEERFSLTKYLPDMDQEMYLRTLKQLFIGSSLHFGSPLSKFFDMMKGGLCEPRVSLYRQGLMYFQKRHHSHFVRKYHNTMVVNLHQIKDAWLSCKGYNIDEKLQVLNVVKSQKSLMNESIEELGSDVSEGNEAGETFWRKKKRLKNSSEVKAMPLREEELGKPNPKKLLTLDGTKTTGREVRRLFPFSDNGLEMMKNTSDSFLRASMRENMSSSYGLEANVPIMGRIKYEDDEETACETDGPLRFGKKIEGIRKDVNSTDYLMNPWSLTNDFHSYGGNRTVDKLSDIKILTAKPSKSRISGDTGTSHAFNGLDPFWRNKAHPEAVSANMSHVYGDHCFENKKWMIGSNSLDNKSVDRSYFHELDAKLSQGNTVQNGGHSGRYGRYRETKSDSSEPVDDDNNPLMRSKLAYPREEVNGSESKKAKIGEKVKSFYFPRKMGRLHHSASKVSEDSLFSGFGKNDKNFKTSTNEVYELNNVPLSLPKWKVTDLHVTKSQQKLGNANLSKRPGKRHADDDLELIYSEKAISVVETGNVSVDEEPKSQKKPFTLITPTVHSGFSFSVVHLLSAVRMAMLTMLPENSLDMNISEPSVQSKVPSLTLQEIVNRVRSNPGDPSILETQEPLQDLVRGVLKIFSSKTAPLGAKGWKSLASYEKPTKSWSWTGPVPQILPENEINDEVTSPEACLVPHKMLVKLVDAFANWLKSSQEALRQLGSLPNPPLSLTQFNTDEKERFRDLRAQKSLNTISPSTEDIRDYFRKEEFLRYSIPDRAFSYTAIDGKKSIVAPLRRCGGKPTSKARDHFMLKRDRPPHVTILCLVRDAAARLPGSIGTRADVCTLIRDSQYIVEDVSDAQVNQVVSGAMDRLHYERDPCVQFDGERKLWVYLHRDREEEDFEDDGTSSTKKWKRQKKEAPEEPFEQEMVTLAYHDGVGQSDIDVGSDLNAKPLLGNEYKAGDLFSYHGNHTLKDNVELGVGSELRVQSGLNYGSDLNMKPSYGDEPRAIESLYYNGDHRMEDNVESGGAMQQSPTMAWESLGLNSTRQENSFLCQENFKNDDLGKEMVVRESPDEIISSSL